jgi:hypothetical protein
MFDPSNQVTSASVQERRCTFQPGGASGIEGYLETIGNVLTAAAAYGDGSTDRSLTPDASAMIVPRA